MMDEKAKLIALTSALRRLHQKLVDVARRDYEQEWGSVDVGQLLQLLTKHPGFGWLRELSALMTSIDELTDHETVSPEAYQSACEQTKALVLLAGSQSTPYTEKYRHLLQTEPLVAMEHAGIRRLLNAR
ncbi:hypothetical protein [Noviherbaspirillum aerium]|uniref:hypothetical protein n=1 Tax=Noviherbaspirillum aerium TaxID=2588497 RepID=UPI00124CCABE|nr:hypothetical protein [Noviherbaspirillum aerium]